MVVSGGGPGTIDGGRWQRMEAGGREAGGGGGGEELGRGWGWEGRLGRNSFRIDVVMTAWSAHTIHPPGLPAFSLLSALLCIPPSEMTPLPAAFYPPRPLLAEPADWAEEK